MNFIVYLFDEYRVTRSKYLVIRRKELKRHARGAKLHGILDVLYPLSKPLLERLYWHP